MKKKIEKFKKSKFLVFILGLTIGITMTYNYIEGKKLYEYIKGGLDIVYAPRVSLIRTPAVSAAENQESPSPVNDPLTIEEVVKKHFGGESDNALKIAMCESSMNPLAVNDKNTNGSIDCGLFQINSIHGYDCEELKDVEFNVKVAKKLYDKSGWRPWACRGVLN